MSTIDHRDYAVIQLVAQFRQLTAAQIHELLFAEASRMACYRALERLRQRKYLHRLEHRLVGGAKGGSGQYVWMLGPEGRQLVYGESTRPRRSISYHTLEIANTYLCLVRMERMGVLRIAHCLTEPECHESISGQRLEPDLFVELELTAGPRRHLWIEVDMATKTNESEGRKQIKDKLHRYWRAYTDEGDHWPDYLLQRDGEGNPICERVEADGRTFLEPKRWFPVVVWLAQDEYRLQALQRMVSEGTAESRELFRVMTLEGFAAWLS